MRESFSSKLTRLQVVTPDHGFFFFYISNEKILLKYQKSITQVYRKYTLGTRNNQKHKLQASIKEKQKKIEWLPVTDNQSNKFLKKKNLRSGPFKIFKTPVTPDHGQYNHVKENHIER